MIIKKLSLFFFICLLVSVSAVAAPKLLKANSNFEFVESVPINTIYGQPGVRRTKQVWLDMINSAKHTIDIGSFYLSTKPNSAMAPIIVALKRAAHRGVKIRIVLEKFFQKQSQSGLTALKNQPNIIIRLIPMHKIAGGVMHAKYMIVDHKNVFVGSQNFDWKALEHIHEIGVRINNQRLAKTILSVFDLDWALAKTPYLSAHLKLIYNNWKNVQPVTDNRPIQIKTSQETLMAYPAFSPKGFVPKGLNSEIQELISLFKNAHHQILIQMFEYSPLKSYGYNGYWPALANAIRKAATRGVKIKMIVSNWYLEHPDIDFLKSLALTPNVEIKYGVVPPYKNHPMTFARVEHCKYMVVDNDFVWIGTGNWRWGYFYDTRDISMIIHGIMPAKLLTDIFNRDWHGPYTHVLKQDKVYHSPKFMEE